MKTILAEADDSLRNMLTDLLQRWSHDVIQTVDSEEVVRVFERTPTPRLAILGSVGSGEIPHLCREIRKRTQGHYTYILLLSETGDNQTISALDAGADDALPKPFQPEDLRGRLRAAQRVLSLQDNIVTTRDALWFQATHDSLTGLWNRASSVDILRREIQRMQRENSGMGVFLAGIDRMQTYNAQCSYSAGDALLRQVADRLRSTVRTYDTVGRMGSDQFLVLLPGLDQEHLFEHAERLRHAAVAPETHPVITVPFSLSLGATWASGQSHADEVIHEVEVALAHAKSGGRNRSMCYEKERNLAPVVAIRTGT